MASRPNSDKKSDSHPSGYYAAIARRCWPDDHLGLHLIHALEVKAISTGRERRSTFLTKAEIATVERELAALEVAG